MSKIKFCLIYWLLFSLFVMSSSFKFKRITASTLNKSTDSAKSMMTTSLKPLRNSIKVSWVKTTPKNIKERILKKKRKYKYILHYTSATLEPFKTEGLSAFANCSLQKCFVTSDKYFLGLNKTDLFDIIVFDAPDIWNNPRIFDWLPTVRHPYQKFVFFSLSVSYTLPMCDKEFDHYFNLTWTYKLDSDLVFPYMIIRNSSGDIIGPRRNINWLNNKDMTQTNDTVRHKLKSKTKAVAWLLSVCDTYWKRKNFVDELNGVLLTINFKVDIYSSCSPLHSQCGNRKLIQQDCWELFQLDYYFYLSFENWPSDDYVTEELLNPLRNNIVPIVYGEKDYTRFLPKGSYLDAKELGPIKLGNEILNIIHDMERYYKFFRWQNHYSYHSPFEAEETNPICSFCKLMNARVRRHSHKQFRNWWNEPGLCPPD